VEINDLNKNNRSFFKNRPLIKALAFFAAGIVISSRFELNYLYSLVIFIALLMISFYFYIKDDLKTSGKLLCIMLFALGWFRADLASGPFPPNHINNLAKANGNSVAYGKIVEEPDIRDDCTYLVIEADSVSLKDYMVPSFGRLRAKVLDGGTKFDHSDYVAVKGFLYKPGGSRNPGGFDYAGYLRTRDIFAGMSVSGPRNVSIIKRGSSFLSSVIKPVRNYMISVGRENLSPVSAAVLSGFILGERRDIPEEYQTMFRDTGTLHLMAVSGSNVGLILTVFALPLTFLGLRRKPRVVILLAVVVFFAILTRLESSVVRASIMALVGLLAYGWVRKPDYINLLGFAGLVMLFWRPLQLFDVGLQLSFAATFGIVFVVPDVYRRIKPLTRRKRRWIRWIVIALATTIAAQAAVLPLMLLYFNRFPLVGIFANLPVALLASIASAMGIALYLFGLLGGWLVFITAGLIEFVLNLVRTFLEFFNGLPLAAIRLPSFGWPAIFLYWIMLYLVYELLIKRRFSGKGVIGALLFFNLMIWPRVFEGEPVWSMEFIDAGPNRAWVFADKDGNVTGCFDIYREDRYIEGSLISNILNLHGGRLDRLISSTPDCKTMETIQETFQPEIIRIKQSIEKKDKGTVDGNKMLLGSSDGIKFVWGQSDNSERGSLILPLLLVDTDEYHLLMAGRSGIETMQNIDFDRKIGLLEMPWSAYARTDCMRTIEKLNPDCVVFSPDRNSTGIPRRRSDLTHSPERLFATSIYGGFRIEEIDGNLRIKTMEPVKVEE
jgi:ComEC/Rec2-related protein